MINPAKTVAFTGHRPEKIRDGGNENSANVLQIKTELRRLILEKINAGCTCFLSGMAMGTDLWAAEIVLSLKQEYPHITLIAAVPFPEQADDFPRRWKERYAAALSRCDEIVTVSPQKQTGGFMRRNKWMIDHSAHLIGVYNGCRGGSMQTINMALLNGSDIKLISC